MHSCPLLRMKEKMVLCFVHVDRLKRRFETGRWGEFLAVTLCYSFARCHHCRNWAKGTRDPSASFLKTVRVYDNFKIKTWIKKNKRQKPLRAFNLPKSGQVTSALEGILFATEIQQHCWLFFFFFLKLFNVFSFKILPRTLLHPTYSLRKVLISFWCARNPFLEVKTSVSHIQSKMRHRTELFRTLWNTIWQRRCFSSSNMSSH